MTLAGTKSPFLSTKTSLPIDTRPAYLKKDISYMSWNIYSIEKGLHIFHISVLKPSNWSFVNNQFILHYYKILNLHWTEFVSTVLSCINQMVFRQVYRVIPLGSKWLVSGSYSWMTLQKCRYFAVNWTSFLGHWTIKYQTLDCECLSIILSNLSWYQIVC